MKRSSWLCVVDESNEYVQSKILEFTSYDQLHRAPLHPNFHQMSMKASTPYYQSLMRIFLTLSDTLFSSFSRASLSAIHLSFHCSSLPFLFPELPSLPHITQKISFLFLRRDMNGMLKHPSSTIWNYISFLESIMFCFMHKNLPIFHTWFTGFKRPYQVITK
jgi:hypothetical protein